MRRLLAASSSLQRRGVDSPYTPDRAQIKNNATYGRNHVNDKRAVRQLHQVKAVSKFVITIYAVLTY